MDTDIHEFDLCFYAGELVIEDVPAKWNATFVNEGSTYHPRVWCHGCELIGFRIGGLTFTRDMLVAMGSEAEVAALENERAEWINENIGDYRGAA